MKNKIIYFVVALSLLLAGGIAGYYISELQNNEEEIEHPFSETRTGGFQFINPLLECDNFQRVKYRPYKKLEAELIEYIEMVKKEKKCSHVSVYFRDLNSGAWLGINEDKLYAPASLLKVPVLIAVMKNADMNRGFLDIEIPYNNRMDLDMEPNIYDSTIVVGKKYTVLELTRRMIKFSDNEAKELLMDIIDEDLFMKVCYDLGINFNDPSNMYDIISVKQYSSFFRMLYNATYLSKRMSEISLKILSESNFNFGLEGQLPPEIVVAHKFGERGFVDSNIKQLHDCGIIYYPKSPYLLCVMTKGVDFLELGTIISDISIIVYENIDEKKRSK